MYDDIKKKLIDIQYSLPRQQKKVCQYCIENLETISMLTIDELAEKTGVGRTTIIRFLNKIGYQKFSEFKNEITSFIVTNKSNTWWHLQKSLEKEVNEGESGLVHIGKHSIQDIKAMVNKLKIEDYNTFIQTVLNANTLYFLGLRTSKSISIYFEMMLKGILKNTRQLSWNTDYLYDEALNFEKRDTLVVIALSPYAKQTVEFSKYCAEKKRVKIALITDVETCPIIQYSDAHLVVGQNKERYSIVPVIALIESIIIDLGKANPNSIENISKLNKIHREKDITII